MNIRKVVIVVTLLFVAIASPAWSQDQTKRPGSGQSELTTETPTAAAQRRRIIEGYSAEFYAGNRIESGTVVGTCNTAASCDALKAACKPLNKHVFETTGGGGICIDTANATSTGTWFLRNSNTPGSSGEKGKKDVSNPPTARRRTNDVKINDITLGKIADSEPALNCEGAVLCARVKRVCPTLGGSYTQLNEVEGTCRQLPDSGAQRSKEPEAGMKEMQAEKEKEQSQRNEGVGRATGHAVDTSSSMHAVNKVANAAKPDLSVKQFLFPPTNDKALRVQVVNQGNSASGACRLVLTVRKINGTAVGRQTHVNIPALAPGKTAWLVVDAKSILPNNVSLQSTTFKLNADATEIVAESNEGNNEVWHNL